MPPSRGYEAIVGSDHDGSDVRLVPAQGAGWLSRIVLFWTSAVTRVGSKRPLQMADLWQLPQRYEPAQLHTQFEEAWQAEQNRCRRNGSNRVNMFRVEWRLFWKDLCLTGLFTILSTVCQFGAPTFVGRIVSFAEETAAAAEAAP